MYFQSYNNKKPYILVPKHPSLKVLHISHYGENIKKREKVIYLPPLRKVHLLINLHTVQIVRLQ